MKKPANETTTEPAPSGFQFDAEGVCINPERIDIQPTPRGVKCALYVAQLPNGRWTCGCILCESGLPATIVPAKLRDDDAGTTVTRAEALETAAAIVRDLANDNAAVVAAVDAWAASQFPAPIPANIAPPPAPAPIAPPPPEAPAAPVPPETPAAPLPGLEHGVNENGVFVNPERVEIPTPKKTRCEISLACSALGFWAFGVNLAGPDRGGGAEPKSSGATHPSRAEALEAGLAHAAEWFGQPPSGASEAQRKIYAKAAEAVTKFRDELREKQGSAPIAATPGARKGPAYVTSFAAVPVDRIQPNPANHRKHFEPLALRELAASIVSDGLHQPIAVRRLLRDELGEFPAIAEGAAVDRFELIYGERRWRAVQLAALTTIEAKIYEGLTRKQATAIALIENLQREGINCMEAAEGYAQLMEDEGLTQEQCAERVGKERSTVANALRLLRLTDKVRDLLRAGTLSATHGLALARFVPLDKDHAAFPKWREVVDIMAEEAVREKTPAAAMEKGIPSVTKLIEAGLGVRVPAFGEFRIPAKCRNHAAYFETRDGDLICFAPEHWAAEVDAQKKEAAEREAREEQARKEAQERLNGNGRKQLRIEDLKREDFREFDPSHEGLLDLVPNEKKAPAKEGSRKTTVVTDVQLADRLRAAMDRAIKKNRAEAVEKLDERVRKMLTKLKKVSARELAWLVYLIVDARGREVHLHLSGEVAKTMGIGATAIPTGARACDEFDLPPAERQTYVERRLALLAKADAVSIVQTLIAERLPKALEEIQREGPESTGGRFVKWWLESDTLWLLEETAEGRAELIEQVKNSPAIQKTLAGEPGGEEGAV